MARILVVDDSPDTLHLVSATLESAGHRVIGVADPLGALAIVRTEPIDAAVLDIMMPGLSGWELLEVIRREPGHERLPIVFLSAIGDSGNRARGIRLGADDFLAKPFDPEELLVRLESLIARGATPTAGLQGGLESHPLSEVIQSLEQNGKTGSLEIVAGARQGTILFAAGKIASAEFDGYQDRAAVLALLEVTRGHFRFLAGPVEAGRLRLEPSALLIEAAWVEDELAARRDLVPPLDQTLFPSRAVPTVPEGLKGLPIQETMAALDANAGATLATLLEDRRFPPATLRLTVTWLIQIGVLGGVGAARSRPMAGRSFDRFLRAWRPLHPNEPVEIALVVLAPAWDAVAPLLANLPESLLDADGLEQRSSVCRQRSGKLQLHQDEFRLRLILDTLDDPGGVITSDGLANASSVVLWVSEDLAYEGLERLLNDLETAAPVESRLLVVGALGALARSPRWSALPSAPESLEELLYELAEARN